MHKKLTVGLIAMNVNGKIGAASTLCKTNMHRGKPYFPVICWRGKDGDKPSITHILEADPNGQLFFELHYDQGKALLALFDEMGYHAELRQDMFGKDRMLRASLKENKK